MRLTEIFRMFAGIEAPHSYVWILHIHHAGGDELYAFTSEDKCRDRLVQWAKEYWLFECTPGLLTGLADEEIVAQYFAHMRNEHFTIEYVMIDE